MAGAFSCLVCACVLKWEPPSKGEGVSGLELSLQLALGRRYPEFTLALLDGIRSLFAEHELAKMVFSLHLAKLQRKPWSTEIQGQFHALLLRRQMPLGDNGFIHTELSRLVCLEWLFNNLESLPDVWRGATATLLKALAAQPPLNPLSRKQRKKNKRCIGAIFLAAWHPSLTQGNRSKASNTAGTD